MEILWDLQVHGRTREVRRKVKWREGRSVSCDSLQPHELRSPWNYPAQNTRVGMCSLLQLIFPTQGLNPGLLHCGRVLYQLSHQGSPRILEWVAYPFSSGSSQCRNWTEVSCIAGGFFTNWAIREAPILITINLTCIRCHQKHFNLVYSFL